MKTVHSLLRFLLLCLVPFFYVNSFSQGIVDSDIETKIDSLFDNYDTIPGVSIGVIKDGQLILEKQYGLANLEYNIPISDASVFTLCSVSKQFTVFGLMLLEEKGLLSLDDNIRKYVPELPDYGHVITLRHLANNTSGLRSNLQLLGLKGYTADDMINQQTVNDIIFRQKELNFVPGDKYNYSNSGFVLLAKVIEKVSNKSFSDYMKETVFAPLGMNDSFVMDDYQKVINNKVSSYEISDGKFVFAPSNYSYVGASGVYLTLKDFSKWAANFTNIKVGNQKIFNKMNTKGILNNGEESFYALGQIVQEYNGLHRIWHSGADAGYRAYIGRFPEQNLSFILLSNNANVYAEGEALKVADLFLKPYFKENKTAAIKTNKKTEYINLSSEQKMKLKGSYVNQDYEIIRNINLKNDTLVYIRPDQNNRTTKLWPLAPNLFTLGGNKNVEVLFNNKILKILVDNKEEEKYSKYTAKTYTEKELKEFLGIYYSDELETTYTLKIINNQLTILNSRIGMIDITPLKEDVFLGKTWIFNSLVFERDVNGLVNGFRVSGQRVKNMYFEKNME